MPPFKAATPGTLVTVAATALLVIATISTPIWKSVYFLSANINARSTQSSISGSGTLRLGCFGFCIDDTCTGTSLGYGLDSSAFFNGIGGNNQISSNINSALGGLSTSVIKGLTYPLGLLHPIAAGFAGLAAICGILGHVREMAPFCIAAAQWMSGLGATIGAVAFIFDIVVFTIAKSRISDVTGSSAVNVQAGASYGNAIWLTLAAWILLAISGCCFRFGNHMARVARGNRAEQPTVDSDFAYGARQDALEAEKLRAADGYGHVLGHERGLPSFAESVQRRREPTGETVPLQSMTHYDDDPEGQHRHDATDLYDRQSISGVGAGYGRRDVEQDIVRSPSHAEAFTSMYNSARSRTPSPPIPQTSAPPARSGYPSYGNEGTYPTYGNERQARADVLTYASPSSSYGQYAPPTAKPSAVPFYPTHASQPSRGIGSVYQDPHRPVNAYAASQAPSYQTHEYGTRY